MRYSERLLRQVVIRFQCFAEVDHGSCDLSLFHHAHDAYPISGLVSAGAISISAPDRRDRLGIFAPFGASLAPSSLTLIARVARGTPGSSTSDRPALAAHDSHAQAFPCAEAADLFTHSGQNHALIGELTAPCCNGRVVRPASSVLSIRMERDGLLPHRALHVAQPWCTLQKGGSDGCIS